MTDEGIESEFWSHWYADPAHKSEKEYEDDDFDLEKLVNAGPDEWETLLGNPT